MPGDHPSMKSAQYKCMSVIIVIIISVASYQMSFKVLLLPTFCFAPEKWACKPFESRHPHTNSFPFGDHFIYSHNVVS